jgi:hypothetical protein
MVIDINEFKTLPRKAQLEQKIAFEDHLRQIIVASGGLDDKIRDSIADASVSELASLSTYSNGLRQQVQQRKETLRQMQIVMGEIGEPAVPDLDKIPSAISGRGVVHIRNADTYFKVPDGVKTNDQILAERRKEADEKEAKRIKALIAK